MLVEMVERFRCKRSLVMKKASGVRTTSAVARFPTTSKIWKEYYIKTKRTFLQLK